MISMPLHNAAAYDATRPELLKLAKEFVNRIGQKMQVAPTEEQRFSHIPENEVLIIQPRIGGKIFIDASLGAIRKNHTTYLSFREFCDGMNFPLRVDTENLTAHGWFIKEKNTFSMNLAQGVVESRGQRFDVTQTEWFQQDNEIYVSSGALTKWMGIENQLDPEVLLLDVASAEPFPLEERLERRKTKLDSATIPKEPQLPRQENPYRIASVPNTDITLGMGINKQHHQTPTSTINQSVSTAGDLFGLTSRTFTTLNRDHGVESFRFTLGKKSDVPDLLGALKAREYAFGDIFPTELSGTGASEQEFGARVTNTENGELITATTRTFEGDVPPDWDVELYDGAQLIAFQTVGNDGRYRFSGIDLFAGENDFRLVFYGPQGEVREEEVSIPISLAEVGKDERLYDVSLSLNNVHTFDYVPVEDDDKGIPHLVISYEQGIRDGLTVGAGVNIKQANEKIKLLAKGAAAMRIGATLLNTDIVTDEELETSFLATARRAFGDHNFIATNYLATSNFDPDNTGASPIIFRNEFSARGPITELFGHELSYTAITSYSENANDNNRIAAKLGQSMRLGRYTLGHSLDFDRSFTAGEQTQGLTSNFSARGSFGQTRMRGNLVYRYYPDTEWDALSININRYLTKNLQGEIEIRRNITPDSTEGTVQANWRTDNFILTPRVTYNTDHDLRATVNMRFGLVYDEFDQSVTMTRDNVTQKGAVHAFVYLDKDGNRVFDQGQDEPIEGAKVLTVQFARNKLTDKNGIALLSDLPEFEPTDVVIDQATLGDPYYVVGFEGLSVSPRPGAPTRLEFPIHISGEMDGTVYKPNYKGLEPASGLRIQLFNTKGDVVLSSLTAYDGYYVISVIPPGEYLMMVNPDDLRGSGYRQPWPQKITIGYDGKVLAGQDIYLEKGDEIPVNFFKVAKAKPQDATPGLPSGIEIRLGAYRSSLLAQVMKIRVNRALHQSGLPTLPMQFRDTEMDKRPAQELIATLPTTAMNEARGICNALSVHKLTCALTLPPGLLIKDNAQADMTPKNPSSLEGG